MKIIRFIEMFSGIGGFRLGLEKTNKDLSGIEEGKIQNRNGRYSSNFSSENGRGWKQCSMYRCVWSNDNDRYACQIYRRNFGNEELVEADIKTINPDTIPDFELLTAGFPCQSFSVAGKRMGFQDPRGTLFYDILRVAKAKRPKMLLLENVRGLLSIDRGKTFKTILQELGNIGYWIEWQVLNSKHHGVPQNRARVFIIGHLTGAGGQEIFPIGENSKVSPGKDETRTRWTQAEVSSTIRGSNVKADHTFILQKIGNIARSGHDSLWGRVYDPKGIAMNLNAKGGGVGAKTGLYAVGVTFANTSRYKQGVNRSPLKQDDKSWALNSAGDQGVLFKQRIRRLTPVECERLQAFPDNFTKYGIDTNGKQVLISNTQRYKVLGNAVTVNVIEFLGREIVKQKI